MTMSGVLAIVGWGVFFGVFIVAGLRAEIRRYMAIRQLRRRYEQPARLASYTFCEQIWQLPPREPGRRPRC